MSTIQASNQGITLATIKYYASQTAQKFSYFTKVDGNLNIYVLKGMDKVKLFFEKMLNILTFGFAFSSENSLLGRIRSAKNYLLQLDGQRASEFANKAISAGKIEGILELPFDPFHAKAESPELAIALLGYAVEQELYYSETQKLVISKAKDGYILERVSKDDKKSTDLSLLNQNALRDSENAIRDAAKKDHGSNFSIETITSGINYLFGEPVEENSSDNTFFEGIDPNMLPSVEDLLSDLSASSTRGNSPIGRHSADELSLGDLEQLREDLTVELAKLQSNPFSFPGSIYVTQKRLLDVYKQQIKQV